MKIFLLFLTFLLTLNVYAYDDVITLQNYSIETLEVPQTLEETLERANDRENFVDEKEYELVDSDEDVFENKAGRTLTKFINNRVVNNKLNLFTTSIGEDE